MSIITSYNPDGLNRRSSDDIDIGELIQSIKNQRRFIIIFLLFGLIVSLFASQFTKSEYTANTSILIDGLDFQQITDQGSGGLAKTLPMELGYILTEIEVMKSPILAEKIINRLELNKDPEFNTSLRGTDILGSKDKKSIETQTVLKFLSGFKAAPIPGSLAIKINYTSEDPEKAAYIANVIVEEYMAHRIAIKNEKQEKLTEWLASRIEKLKQQVNESEMQVEAFRAENELFSGSRGLLSTEELSNFSNQLVIARKNYLDKKAMLDEVVKVNSNTISNKSVLATVDSTVIKNLLNEKYLAETDLTELSNRYGPKHPLIIDKNTKMGEINKKIEQQLDVVEQSLRDEVSIAKSQVDEIERTLTGVIDETNVDNSAMVELRDLEREAQASRSILESFLDKFARISDKNFITDSGIRVISYATAPLRPSSPDQKLLTLLGVFLSSILAIGLALLKEKFGGRFTSPEDLENQYKIPCLATIRYNPGKWSKDFIDQIIDNPTSPIFEDIRNLRIGIKNQILTNGKSPKVVTVLSSLKGEGKTLTACLLATLAAKAGERTILIDANLRDPAIHSLMKQSNNNNLIDFLTDQKPLNDIIHKDRHSGLNIVFGSAIPHNSFNLLSMKKLDVLIEALKHNYDLIVIDTPSCTEASDARLIEQLTDISLYHVKQNATKNSLLQKVLKPFLMHKNGRLAFVLTQIR